MGSRDLCFCPSIQMVVGMNLVWLCGSACGWEKMGGSDVVEMVMGVEWLRRVITKSGSRVVCDCERRWR